MYFAESRQVTVKSMLEKDVHHLRPRPAQVTAGHAAPMQDPKTLTLNLQEPLEGLGLVTGQSAGREHQSRLGTCHQFLTPLRHSART
jgi:hypothetical protein